MMRSFPEINIQMSRSDYYQTKILIWREIECAFYLCFITLVFYTYRSYFKDIPQ